MIIAFFSDLISVLGDVVVEALCNILLSALLLCLLFDDISLLFYLNADNSILINCSSAEIYHRVLEDNILDLFKIIKYEQIFNA